MVAVVAVQVAPKVLQDIAAKEEPMAWEDQEGVLLPLTPVVAVVAHPEAVVVEFLEVGMEIFMVVAVAPPDVLGVPVEMVEMVLQER